MELPEPGIYHGISFAEYVSWPAINSSSLKWAEVSPLHCKAALDGKMNDDSTAKKFGRAIHCRLLEPEKYKEEFITSDKCCARTKKENTPCKSNGKFYDGENWFCGTHKTSDAELVDCISTEEGVYVERMAEALHNHESMVLFARKGWSEASIVYEYKNLMFKSRLDRFINDDRPVILDIKSAIVGKATRDAMKKSVTEYKWHQQAYLYQLGIEILTGKRPDFAWIFIEKGEPFDANVMPIDEVSREIAEQEVNELIDIYRRAKRADRFHGYVFNEFSIKPGGLTDWAIKQHERIHQYDN
jgi:ATP-dependent exoDNAse (exonuclease V) beta subunit